MQLFSNQNGFMLTFPITSWSNMLQIWTGGLKYH